MVLPLQTDLKEIELIAVENEQENERFRRYLKQQNSARIDRIVHELNAGVSIAIDCTKCGNCCKSLMINVTSEETILLAERQQTTVAQVKEKYIEESEGGEMIINAIPCHFLTGTTCSIYEDRFTDCRDFPHLHKPHFTSRLFGTMMYYAMCPITFNVVENLKRKLKFR